jgi:hypothetical protein
MKGIIFNLLQVVGLLYLLTNPLGEEIAFVEHPIEIDMPKKYQREGHYHPKFCVSSNYG